MREAKHERPAIRKPGSSTATVTRGLSLKSGTVLVLVLVLVLVPSAAHLRQHLDRSDDELLAAAKVGVRNGVEQPNDVEDRPPHSIASPRAIA